MVFLRTGIKIILTISFLTLASLLILPFIFIYFNINLEPFNNLISSIGSFIVILLMLVTIILTENASTKQIESWERWDATRRKQSIKSLIMEFKLNMELYDAIKEESTKTKVNPPVNDFILTSIERSLYNSPIDDDELNQKILLSYYVLKGSANHIIGTRNPVFKEKTVLNFLKTITSDYERNKGLFNSSIEMLEKYEQNVRLQKY